MHSKCNWLRVSVRFDGCRVFSAADEVGRRTSAEQQPDSLDENRLARAGLAREDVEARFALNRDRVDDRQVGNIEEAEHCKRRELQS